MRLNSAYIFKSSYEIQAKLHYYEIQVNEETIKANSKNL
jgi:hypothetical protein